MTRVDLATPLRRLTTFLIDIDPKDTGSDRPLPERVHVERVDVALRLAPYLVALQAGAVTLAIVTLENCWRWRTRGVPETVSPRFLQATTAVALLAGLLLASIPITLFATSDMPGQLLISSTCAGLIATGMCLATVPRASFAYVGPIVTGSFLALAMTGELYNIYLALLLAFYALFIFTAMFHLRRLVTKRVLTQIELSRQQELTNLLLNDFEAHASDWLWETDEALGLQHVSPRLAEVIDLPESILHGVTIERLLTHVAAARLTGPGGVDPLLADMAARAEFHDRQVQLHVSGEARWWSLSGKPIRDREGRFLGYRGVGSDITDQKRLTWMDSLNYSHK